MPFCSHCGQKLDDGARFCAACGTPAASTPAAPAVSTPTPAAPAVSTPAAGMSAPTAPAQPPVAVAPSPVASAPAETPVAAPAVSTPAAGTSAPTAPAQPPVAVAPSPAAFAPAETPVAPAGTACVPAPAAAPTAPKKKKKKTGKRIALITAGVAVVAAAAVAVVMFVLPMLNTVETPPYALYIKDNQLTFAGLKGIDPLEVTEDLTWLSSSGRVNPAYTLSNMVRVVGNRIFYIDGGKEDALGAPLCFRAVDDPDGEPVEVDSAVCNYLVTEDGKTLLYLTAEKSNENFGSVGTLYRYDIAAEDAEKLASEVYDFLQASPDGKAILYADSKGRYYLVRGDEETALPKDCTNVFAVTEDLSVICYVTEDNTLYRTENGGDAETICENFNGFCSPSEDGSRFFYSTLDESAEYPLSDFLVDDTADSEPPVEPTFPEAPVYSDYVRGDGGTDWDAYNAAYEEYRAQRDAYDEAYNDYRQQLDAYNGREELLKDAENELYYLGKNTLYFYDNGTSVKLTEGYQISYVTEDSHSLLVYTATAVGELPKIPLSTVDSVWDLGSKIDAAFAAARTTYMASGGNTVMLTEGAVTGASVTKDGTVYYLMADETDTEGNTTFTLYKTKADGGTLGRTEQVDTQTNDFMTAVGNNVIYYKNESEPDEDTDWTIYADAYINGTKIGSSSPLWEWESDGDSGIALLTDCDQQTGVGTLYLYRDGKMTKVADRVSDFAWSQSGELLYLCNVTNGKGDLCVYANGAAAEIDSEVQAIVPPYSGNTCYYIN